MSSYTKLALSFFRSGVLGYGGGPSVIPLIHYETVTKYGWMDGDEFAEVLALANALPGPIATKMAAYIGYRVAGVIGATVAILAHIFLTVVVLIALLGSLYALKGSHVVQGMIAGVKPVIAVMLAVMAYEFFVKSWKVSKVAAVIMTVISFVALQLLNIHPAIVIVVFMLYAVVQSTRAAKVKKRQQTNKGEVTSL